MKPEIKVSFVVVFAILVASIVTNIYQYRTAHTVGYASHITINGVPAPDKIVWNGHTYWTEGAANQALVQLKWLGTVIVGNKNINIFAQVGQSTSPKQIFYIMGNRLATAVSHPGVGQ
ncbi:hypothetical protein [Alicyclobacillus fodiniaquatilis]|uniref:Uncharacterized protein n=1 Tax=Alicyclobacillus fodiniaquatilis TaxID=1661150 RepID=A0ABW4JEZ4_9BACL